LGAWRSAASTDRRPFEASIAQRLWKPPVVGGGSIMVLASRCGSARIAEYWDHFQAIPALKIDLFIARNELVQKHTNQPFAVGSTRLSIVKELDKINIIEGLMWRSKLMSKLSSMARHINPS
jgi:hypothetical protein